MHYRHGQPIPGTQYRFIRELGAGGHGTVYAVEHTFLEAPAVMKLLHAELVDRGDLADRMTREAKTLAKLRHPNIVEVRDGGISGETPARPYFVMEALNGMPLRELLRHVRGTQGVGVMPALRIMAGVLDGLEHAHRAGVIHRDIKPDNVFLHRTATDVTVPKILDFGIAHLLMGQRTTGRYFLGTPRYAAPEQLRGDAPTARTDIYAAGLLLYEMLTGEAPFAHLREVGDILKAHMEDSLPLVSSKCREVPPYLANFVAQMVEKDPDKRPPTAFAAAVGIREIRARIESEQAGALNNTGFKTEPTPMENMLVGASPRPAGAVTQTEAARMSGLLRDTIVEPPALSGGGLKTTVVQPPRMVGGGVVHPMAVAETEVDTPRGAPNTPRITPGGVDRNAATNTSAPFVPRQGPNFDTEQLLEGIAGAAQADALAPPPASGGEERTTGAIAMSRSASHPMPPPREGSALKKQLIAFFATLVVFAVISVPVLWKLKKEYGTPAEAAPAPPPPAVTTAAVATATATATAAPAQSETAAPEPKASVAAPAPSPSVRATSRPAPAPAPAEAKPKPKAKPQIRPDDPTSVPFD